MGKFWHIENGHLAPGSQDGAVEVEMSCDISSVSELAPEHRSVLAQLKHAAIPFAERVASGVVGVIVAPAGAWRFGFVLSAHRLLLVDGHEVCMAALNRAVDNKVSVSGSAGALCAVLRELLRDHPTELSLVHEDFELFEDQILEGNVSIDRGKMMDDTRKLLGLDTFYQGMSDLVEEILEEELSFVTSAERTHLRALERQLSRLSVRLESVQDYSLQVHSLYQESIDIRQNNVMQWLTVVATIAMPLTFITGWYGMNFPHMGLINNPWGYPIVIVLCLVVIIGEIIFFWRNGWLSFGGVRHKRNKRQ